MDLEEIKYLPGKLLAKDAQSFLYFQISIVREKLKEIIDWRFECNEERNTFYLNIRVDDWEDFMYFGICPLYTLGPLGSYNKIRNYLFLEFFLFEKRKEFPKEHVKKIKKYVATFLSMFSDICILESYFKGNNHLFYKDYNYKSMINYKEVPGFDKSESVMDNMMVRLDEIFDNKEEEKDGFR